MARRDDRYGFGVIACDIRGNLAPLHRAMITLGAKQVPFAMSLAINTLARGVAADQVDLIGETFDTPTPFTEKAYRIEAATKAKPVAVVAAKDIQAQYLAPYVFGRDRFLGRKKGMIAPRGIALNQYGNLPKSKLASLKARPGVFIGPVTFAKTGKTVHGVWQRSKTKRGARTNGNGGYGTKGKHRTVAGARTTLRLLIQFEDTTPAPKRLPFERRARGYLSQHANAAFTDALRRALATARR